MIAKIIVAAKIIFLYEGMPMLSQTDVNILRMLALGFEAQEIATTLNLDIKKYTSLYANLQQKTKSWDEFALGVWWQKNQNEYTDILPNNLVTFDFTKI